MDFLAIQSKRKVSCDVCQGSQVKDNMADCSVELGHFDLYGA